ncbi:glycosyltransferase [Conservatibacter flavescens]|uniref:Glycosyl transferase n=1 Tax=Conservatibacter flavescens TaxID=28161 RepID=A0A2M8S462_9PAST|nr:glycosyltransferase [Conservatibacter flavescens]PJG85917.1 glycosyl transferase [Conservatibacter flavescens]
MTRICLNMIVKNEGGIIRETLNNILAHIPLDYWVICDTGSTDNTREEIVDFFTARQIPGELHQDDWQDFAHNRNLALQRCVGKSDYVLIFDADDRFEGHMELPTLSHDMYYLQLSNGGGGHVTYYRALLVKNHGQWYWRGVLHEFLALRQSGDMNIGYIKGDYVVVSGRFGARSQQANKYLQDAHILKKAFEGPDDEDLKPRYAFYCAQSYRDAGHYEQAAKWYLTRIQLGQWREEVTCAYENLGQCYADLNLEDKALMTWLKGYDYDPTRIECLYFAVKHLRQHGHCRLGYQLAKLAKATPYPEEDVLFVKSRIYHFWIDYELSICAYYVQDFALGYQCCKHVLANNPPNNIAQTTISNLKFYKQHAAEDSRENVQQLLANIQRVLPPNPSTSQQLLLNYFSQYLE